MSNELGFDLVLHRMPNPTVETMISAHSFNADNFFSTFIPELLAEPSSEGLLQIKTLLLMKNIVKIKNSKNLYVIKEGTAMPYHFTLLLDNELLSFWCPVRKTSRLWNNLRRMGPKERDNLKGKLIQEINKKFEKPNGQVTIHLVREAKVSGLGNAEMFWKSMVATKRETNKVIGIIHLRFRIFDKVEIWYNADVNNTYGITRLPPYEAIKLLLLKDVS